MLGGYKLDDEDKRRILKLKKEGLSNAVIAKRFGVTDVTIANVLKRIKNN